jgi:hypothetical protein
MMAIAAALGIITGLCHRKHYHFVHTISNPVFEPSNEKTGCTLHRGQGGQGNDLQGGQGNDLGPQKNTLATRSPTTGPSALPLDLVLAAGDAIKNQMHNSLTCSITIIASMVVGPENMEPGQPLEEGQCRQPGHFGQFEQQEQSEVSIDHWQQSTIGAQDGTDAGSVMNMSSMSSMAGLSNVSIGSADCIDSGENTPPFAPLSPSIAFGSTPRLMSPRMLSNLPPVARNALTQTLMLKQPLTDLGLDGTTADLSWISVDDVNQYEEVEGGEQAGGGAVIPEEMAAGLVGDIRGGGGGGEGSGGEESYWGSGDIGEAISNLSDDEV